MQDLLTSGLVVDVALLIVAAEAVLLVLMRRGRRPGPGALLINLASGACLMLALRAVLAGAPGFWLAAALAGAGLAHVADLWLRLRSAAR
ncbi:hypothetical protein [Methylobacterium nonmethylotrophicum]|uniref:Uncharacterized protein n=1 Tax=Methylobacterium nonmethylotrophicum TaxID=1141884 RepID=A0A4Z0NQ23_9HYPH|nr:hypothetical protein [Methylobacterium nonmethylotrophicum]TGD98748.1 hypothetical protein EU555_15570 [Methylobacterium nonmethylotrophicum]